MERAGRGAAHRDPSALVGDMWFRSLMGLAFVGFILGAYKLRVKD